MTIRFTEKPRQAANFNARRPTASREWTAFGSWDRNEITFAVALHTPRYESLVDPDTQSPVVVFRNDVGIEEIGGGIWSVKVNYGNSPDTIELAISFGAQNTKIYTALADVRAYNCIDPASVVTQGLASTVTAAMVTALAAATEVTTVTGPTVTLIVNSSLIPAANDPAVTPSVRSPALQAATAALLAVTHANAAAAATLSARTSAEQARDAALLGDFEEAISKAAESTAYAQAAVASAASVLTASNDTQTQATAAGLAVFNAEDLIAADFAQDAADATAAPELYTDALAASAAATAVALAATNAANSSENDSLPGENGVPDFNKAIGVNGDEVEGVEIEVGAFELSITKKWKLATLPSGYINVLSEFTKRSAVNHATYVIYWMGQTLTFPRGTLRFRSPSVKWTSEGELEIVYHFAYERSIIASDNFRVGNSGRIEKEGQLYGWTRFQKKTSGGRVITEAASYHVQQVYPYLNFAELQV